LRVAGLVAVDVAAVLIVTLFVSRGVVPLYPAAAIGYPVLFVVNVLWLWIGNRQSEKISIARRSVPLSLWIVAGIFTSAGTAAVLGYLNHPSIPLGVQAAVSILLVGYLWFLIYRLRRGGYDHEPR
jgi:putative flippase GtrA